MHSWRTPRAGSRPFAGRHWVAVKELSFSYDIGETTLIPAYTHDGHLILSSLTATQDKTGLTPAHEAAANARAEVLQTLYDLRVNLSARDKSGQTPVHVAASHGHGGVLRKLKELGLSVSSRDESGSTAAHKAAARGHEGVFKDLKTLGGRVWAPMAYRHLAC